MKIGKIGAGLELIIAAVRFNRIEHLSWAIEKAVARRADCNLCLSAMEDYPLHLLPWDPELARDNRAEETLRRMLAERYRVAAHQVLVTFGTTGANYLASVALVTSEDWVLVEEPVYEPLWRNFEAIGAKIVFVPRDSDGNLDPERFRKASSDRVKLIVTTNLHNPTGRHTPSGVMRALGRVAAATGAYVLCDEVYLDGLFPEVPSPCVRTIPNGVSTASFTKIYGLGPLRCGWAVGPREVIARMETVMHHLGVRHSVGAYSLGVQAMRRLGELHARAEKRFEENFPLLCDWVESRPHLGWWKPDGGFVAFVRLPEGIDDGAFQERLEREEATWVTPGRFFRAPNHIRIGFGVPGVELAEGLRRINHVLKT